MEERVFKKINKKVSLLGMGGMRLPYNNSEVDEVAAIDLIIEAYNKGINYFDTAYFYHGGQSEVIMGKAFKKIDREKIYIADKLPPWLCNSKQDAEKIFTDQLNKLSIAYFDFYLLHALGDGMSEKLTEIDAIEFLKEKRDEGKIKYIGFSYHGSTPYFKEMLDLFDWDFVQIQINYIDYYEIDAKGLYEAAAAKGISVIAMEPLKGGRLASLSKDAEEFIRQSTSFSPAGLAHKFLQSLDNIAVILSGMTYKEQLDLNIKELGMSYSREKELAVCSKIREILSDIKVINCSDCKYCMPCPFNVNIPRMFMLYNDFQKYPKKLNTQWNYFHENKDSNAEKCVLCGKCVDKCPQKLNIPSELKKVKVLYNSK